jgi:hypothetical protein
MGPKPQKQTTENFVKDIHRKARRLYSLRVKDTYCYGSYPKEKSLS